MSKREAARRAAWYGAFEEFLHVIRPDLAGKVRWSEVEYPCIEGRDPKRSAEAYAYRTPYQDSTITAYWKSVR